MVGRRGSSPNGTQVRARHEQMRAGLARALEWAELRARSLSPDDFSDERRFKQVRTARLKSVRRLERILLSFADGR